MQKTAKAPPALKAPDEGVMDQQMSLNSETELEKSICLKCDATLYEPIGSMRVPCPACGELSRKFFREANEKVFFRDVMEMKGKHGGKGRPFFEAKTGDNFYFKEEKWNHLEQIVDRDNDLYIKIITDPETGEVIRNERKPLSEHQGHGSAKVNGN